MFKIKPQVFSNGDNIAESLEERVKREKEALYYKIGERFYEEYGERIEDSPESFKTLLMDVKKLEDELDAKAKSQSLRKCPTCGEYVEANAAFCTMCGFKLPEVEEEEVEASGNVCPRCGEKIEGNTAFCINCGCKLNLEASRVVNQVIVEPKSVKEVVEEPKPVVIEEVVVDPPKKEEQDTPLFCVECGNKLRPGVKFCTNCGRKIR